MFCFVWFFLILFFVFCFLFFVFCFNFCFFEFFFFCLIYNIIHVHHRCNKCMYHFHHYNPYSYFLLSKLHCYQLSVFINASIVEHFLLYDLRLVLFVHHYQFYLKSPFDLYQHPLVQLQSLQL